MKDLKNFEEALLKKREIIGVAKTSKKNIGSEIVNLKKQVLDIDRVYTKGNPRPDVLIINGIIDPEFFKRINDFCRMDRLVIFPYGIIYLEGFRFQGRLGF